MGRTLLSITQVFNEEQSAFAVFRNTLSPSDQQVLDELLRFAQLHQVEAAYSDHPVKMEIFLVSMLLEERKEVKRLIDKVKRLIDKVKMLKTIIQ